MSENEFYQIISSIEFLRWETTEPNMVYKTIANLEENRKGTARDFRK